jgi:hypothetical protein
MMDVIGMSAIARYFGVPGAKVFWTMDSPKFVWGPALYDVRLFDFSSLSSTVVPYNPQVTHQEFTVDNMNASCTLSYIQFINYLLHTQKVRLNDNDYNAIRQAYIDTGKSIRPSAALQSCLYDTSEYIAVHLRRTDKINSHGDLRHETSTHEYTVLTQRMLTYIESCITQGHTKFYVLSDDEAYKETFANEIRTIGKRLQTHVSILILNKEAVRKHVSTIHPHITYLDGYYDVFEWFCMSQCKAILQGIKYSTFSMSASMLRQVPLMNFTDYNVMNLLNAWMPCLHLFTHYVQPTQLQDVLHMMKIMWNPLHINAECFREAI